MRAACPCVQLAAQTGFKRPTSEEALQDDASSSSSTSSTPHQQIGRPVRMQQQAVSDQQVSLSYSLTQYVLAPSNMFHVLIARKLQPAIVNICIPGLLSCIGLVGRTQAPQQQRV